MSEKKRKHQLDVPVYDIKSQAEYLKKISDHWHVPLDILTGCIFADFIISIEDGLLFKDMSEYELAVSYFKHAMTQKRAFDKIKQKINEEVVNGQKK